MIECWLILAMVNAVPPGPVGSLVVQDAAIDAVEFFESEDAAEGRHYLVVDQRGGASAQEMVALLEQAFEQFEDLLQARPKVTGDNLLRVEILADAWSWRNRLGSLGINPREAPEFSHYDARTKTVLLQAEEIEYRTRAHLLSACVQQFHDLCKRKNDGLFGNWFVAGLAEIFSVHRWDGARLETRAKLQLCTIDTPAMALDALTGRPETLKRFTDDFLERRPVAWALTSFLLEGEGGKHKKRFQKYALGYRGSMLNGEQMALSLGSPERVFPAVETWVRSAQLPLEVLGGDFEDLGGGKLVGTAHGNVAALASPREAASRLRCVFELDGTQGAGLFLDYQSPYFFTYVMFSTGKLWTFKVTRGAHEETEHFRQPQMLGSRVEFEAIRSEGLVEVIVNGESLGSIGVERHRLGLIVQVGCVSATEIDWE